MRRRRIAASLLAVVTAVILTACAGLPTGGGVQEGREAGGDLDAPDIDLLPSRPQPGASPQQIVEGFLRAGSGPGPAGDWSRAREFLMPETEWNPSAGVTIDVFGERDVEVVDDDSITVTIEPVALVDDKGSYERTTAGPTPLQFELEQEGGEWRISSAPDGIVLDTTVFSDVFQEYPLSYFDPTWTYFVPDVRWFPRTNAATRITNALVNQPPSEWLAESVVTAFPVGVTADVSVPVTAGGVATVTLSADALLADQGTLDRMQAQLDASLSAALVNDVQMSVGDTLIAADAVTPRRTSVTGLPLVEKDGMFGFFAGDELTPIPGLSATLESLDTRDVQVGIDHTQAAVRRADGAALRADADGTVTVLDTRAGLIAPTIDAFGVVWTVPRDAPQGLVAHIGGESVTVGEAWPAATAISALVVSREGARVAAVVTSGGHTSVWVAGIIRGEGGVPVRLGEPVVLAVPSGSGAGLAWLDDTSIGVLAVDGETSTVLEQRVGGRGSTAAGPPAAVAIAGANTVATVRILGDDGLLYLKRGANWQVTASDVAVLATQQGAPD